ncbi:sulfopropanediol 3-dehydrogenase [Constrictibacter sp. MBR-5]|jgi:sulfopropanediol 3-dehydrogenase|uniref:histidinol dehydrogenase n=1 Tax=Constrictibacter sp. MBR-5 TaxID=3156467 RepID=UPI003398B61B
MPTYLKRSGEAAAFDRRQVEETVRRMLDDIERNRDEAVRRYARDLDKWQADGFRVSEDRIRDVAQRIPESFKEDYAYALRQVQTFARHQRETMQDLEIETEPGVILGHRHVPVQRVGCYVPGGKYPLVAGAMMSVGTAAVAGVEHIVGCAPPRDADGMYPYTLYAFHAAGAHAIYDIGGVQALAAMAHGCVGIAPVDMIVGPGNPYVAEAKRQLFGIVGIDLLAGPTEILVIADETADPALVATDLLGQAEHGPDSPVWLVTTSRALGEAVAKEMDRQLETLPTAAVAGKAWANNGEIVLVDSHEEAVAVSDAYAPEHLEVLTGRDDWYREHLRNYGSLFVGEESTVAYGDKGVGTNHTLPTGRAARYTGGLWVGKYLKTLTWQRLTPEASRRIAPVMARICEAEGMLAHKLTADVRYARYAPRNE